MMLISRRSLRPSPSIGLSNCSAAPALFDESGHDPAHAGIVEIPFEFDFLILHGGFDHANDVHTQLVSGLHRRFQVFG